MKKTLFTMLLATVASSVSASAYYDTITNLWFTAHQTNVLALANQRLMANTNDIAGLLIRASWDFAFSDSTAISNSLERVLSVGGAITTPAFTNEFAFTRIDIQFTLDNLAVRPEEERAADILKSSSPGRLPHFYEDLKALDDDGYFDNVTSGN